MSWKSIDESPSLSKPATRVSTWLAELVLLFAIIAGGLKLSGSAVSPPAPAPAEITVASAPPPPPPPLPAPPPPPAPAPEPAPAASPTPPPPPLEVVEAKPPTPVIPPYRREWRTAAARAAQRDLDGAAALLRRAARESDEARREAVADMAEIDRLRALEERASIRMSQLPRGSKVELDVRGRGLVAGDLIHADRERLEVRTAEGPRFVEFVDLAWSTLAGWSDEDARAVELALLLDGRRIDAKHGALPAPDPPSPLERSELEARAILYEAERAFRKPASRAAAVAKYRLLLSDFPETSVVRRSMPRLSARSRSPEELYFAGVDLRGVGRFRRHADVWRSEGAIDFSKARFSFVEAEFEAEAGVAHRLFIRLGGCCEERLLAYAQASGLEKLHPARGVKVAVEPGSIYAQILRRPVPDLPKAHVEGHPLRWGWAELLLPSYATAGAKQVRVLADREGVAVAGLLLSTTRTAPPTDPELAALVAARDGE